MKKLIALLLALIMVLGLVACGNNDAPAADAPAADAPAADAPVADAPAADASYVIIDAPKMVGIAWWDRALEGDNKFAADTGHEVYQMGSTTADSALQVGVLQDAIAQQPDVLVVCPLDPAACDPILKQARDAGIVVISHEAPGLENVDYDIEAFGNAEYGAYLMDKLAEQMGEEGEFAIMVGALTAEAHMERAQGAIDCWKEKYPNMTMVTDVVEGGSQDASYSVTKELLTAYPDLAGILGFDTVNPPGCALAVEEAGKAGKVAITGTSLGSMCREFLENGTIKMINFWDPYEVARVECAVGVIVKNGGEVKTGDNLGVPGYENVTVDGHVIYGQAWVDVTVDNMDDYPF